MARLLYWDDTQKLYPILFPTFSRDTMWGLTKPVCLTKTMLRPSAASNFQT